jgi:hypothetical protein
MFFKGKELSANSLGEFVQLVSTVREHWEREPLDELWFRGEDEKHSDTSLRPRLFRSDRPLVDLLEIEGRLFDEFSRCGTELSDVNIEEEWDWYFLMQHHGAPTRLLDWSDGALLALHFAIRDKYPGTDKTDSIVYALDPYWLSDVIDNVPATLRRTNEWKKKAEKGDISKEDWEERMERIYLPGGDEDFKKDPLPNEPLVLDFPHISRRVAAQRSRFIVFGTDGSWLAKLAGKSDSKVSKIRIPRLAIPTMQQDLRACGITESVIFPDLDGLGREISQLWQQCLRAAKK